MGAEGSLLERLSHYVQLSKRRHREGHLTLSRQLIEMALLLTLRGLGPGYYHLAGFWRRTLTWQEKCSHLNGREYQRVLARLNPLPYRKLSENKLAEKAILTLIGIPTPRFLGYVVWKRSHSSEGLHLKSADELIERLCRANVTRFCCKPLEGWSGKGFRAYETVTASEPALRRIGSDDVISAPELYRELETDGSGFIIEELIEQHPRMKAFNPTSVNTLRLWVLAQPGAGPETVVGYLRIGRRGSMVDNQSAGGIVAPIDLKTGAVGAAIDGNPERETFAVHPDHGAEIQGEHVVFLEEAKSLAAVTLNVFPGLNFAGLDVAVTLDGPVILELNVNPDRQGAAFVDVPTREIFAGL